MEQGLPYSDFRFPSVKRDGSGSLSEGDVCKVCELESAAGMKGGTVFIMGEMEVRTRKQKGRFQWPRKDRQLITANTDCGVEGGLGLRVLIN